METLGQRIKRRREELGLTQSELAERLGYKSKVSVSNAENDRDDMTTTRISKYAEALKTTEAYLMGWTEEDYILSQINGDLRSTRMDAYRLRGYWAYHILEVGDKIPAEGDKDIEMYADLLAKKYNIDTTPPEKVFRDYFDV